MRYSLRWNRVQRLWKLYRNHQNWREVAEPVEHCAACGLWHGRGQENHPQANTLYEFEVELVRLLWQNS